MCSSNLTFRKSSDQDFQKGTLKQSSTLFPIKNLDPGHKCFNQPCTISPTEHCYMNYIIYRYPSLELARETCVKPFQKTPAKLEKNVCLYSWRNYVFTFYIPESFYLAPIKFWLEFQQYSAFVYHHKFTSKFSRNNSEILNLWTCTLVGPILTAASVGPLLFCSLEATQHRDAHKHYTHSCS